MPTTDRIRFREATTTDAKAIRDLFKKSFASSLHEFLLFCRKGYHAFIREQISIQNKHGESFYRVAEMPGKGRGKSAELAGAIEMRRFPGSLFVNFIAIRDVCRGKGLGKRLLLHALESIGTAGVNDLRLDVLTSNRGAGRFYANLGFTRTGTSLWLIIPPTPSTPSTRKFEPLIHGFPMARAGLKEFGFGQFQLETGKKVFQIGLFGDHWLRVNHEEIITNGSFQMLLRKWFPDRDIFAILPGEGVASTLKNTPFHIDSTERLQVGFPEILSRLTSDTNKS